MCALRGGEPAGEEKPIEFKDGARRTQHADEALAQADAARRRGSRTSRRPIARWCSPMWKTRYGDYDHLARVKEWSLTGGEDETKACE